MPTYPKTLTALLVFNAATTCYAAYTLKDDYSGAQFFSMFDFFTDNDPTNGYVDYISQSEGQSAGLINATGNQVYVGVDSTNIASGRGRKSVRLTSKASYTHGLFVFDIAHMPGGICGTWPALWTVGKGSWPQQGEIDVIENVNLASSNAMTLHTGPNCAISSNKRDTSDYQSTLFSGKVTTSNCDVKAQGQSANAGCQVLASSQNTFGSNFNNAQGGVYAMEWTSTFIRVFLFPRDSLPTDITSASPDPTKWGTPAAYFGNTACNIDQSFKDHSIVLNTALCGDWSGQTWSSEPACASKAATCQQFVQNNPAAFKDAYWSINSLKVYSSDSSSQPAASNPSNPISSSANAPAMSSATPSTPALASSNLQPATGTTPATLPTVPGISSVLSSMFSAPSASIPTTFTISRHPSSQPPTPLAPATSGAASSQPQPQPPPPPPVGSPSSPSRPSPPAATPITAPSAPWTPTWGTFGHHPHPYNSWWEAFAAAHGLDPNNSPDIVPAGTDGTRRVRGRDDVDEEAEGES